MRCTDVGILYYPIRPNATLWELLLGLDSRLSKDSQAVSGWLQNMPCSLCSSNNRSLRVINRLGIGTLQACPPHKLYTLSCQHVRFG
jgi:hypothetical protein